MESAQSANAAALDVLRDAWHDFTAVRGFWLPRSVSPPEVATDSHQGAGARQ